MTRRTSIILTTLCVVIATLFLWHPLKSMVVPKNKRVKKENNINQENSGIRSGSDNISILNKWMLPDELREVSGIVWLENNRFACVQDEEGTVFIYNTVTNSIEKRISFAGPGDYEGIALTGNTVYIMRADGVIYELDDINKVKPVVKNYKTHLTAKHDVEGFTYDKKGNRLLAAIKGSESGDLKYKGIYAFNLKSFSMDRNPVYKLPVSTSTGNSGKKKNKDIQPSALSINPVTGELYIVDAGVPGIHILTQDGIEKMSYNLNRSEFIQPEGITISPDGRIFISNEGKKGNGNIIEVKID